MSPSVLDHGQLLLRLLPAVYRNRDRADGDLADYFAACGALLDRIQATLEQMRLDSFADAAADGRDSQDWVLPYLAELLDARLIAETAAARREELCHSVEWRQRKGTLEVLIDIAAVAGGIEVQPQEGWRRVAMTPALNGPLASASAADGATVTVDTRRAARAVGLDPQIPENVNNPAARYGGFSGAEVLWTFLNPQGVPEFADSYQDPSRRTVDVRAADPERNPGPAHPRRVVLYYPPPALSDERLHALRHKLREFLPAGTELELVPDSTLPEPPLREGGPLVEL